MFGKVLGAICIIAGIVYIVFDIIRTVKKYKEKRLQSGNEKPPVENKEKEGEK